ncbi:class I SAM-dependent methyltransferase [Roseisolibacter sp. H3M3-2]|uniref:class I SAM-dependent methyltransferase n=1 Tax=Roseisolibacter sp. H3M3-2 TaxID=3031323 RepID=UPI0023DC62B0|nr:class I SAM-dependent methyltransferase [Roseisolibacter sp. H3M3-2]MDF1501459.1 class I SAM-dependent methyltransferase [Roseisolibacter sp. H3M3-2]
MSAPDEALAALDADLAARFEVARETIDLRDEGAHETFDIVRPASAEALIDEDAFARDERLPYWADVWPSARVLAAHLLREGGGGRRLLELGCGSGLVAAAAARAGFAVTASDYYDDALLFTRANVRRAAGVACETRLVDWRAMPDDLGYFDRVVASDVLYERPYAALVARALVRTLARGGVAYVTDPGRLAAPDFVEQARSLGLDVGEPTTRDVAGYGTRQTIRLYRLRRR